MIAVFTAVFFVLLFCVMWLSLMMHSWLQDRKLKRWAVAYRAKHCGAVASIRKLK